MARTLKLDMTGVENYSRVNPGQHVAKLIEIDDDKTTGEGDQMLVITFEVTKGADKGSTIRCNFPMNDKSLWKFKGLLTAIGIKADGKIRIDLDKLIGKVCIIEVVEGEYNGKPKSEIDSFKKLEAAAKQAEEDEDEDEDEDDEEEAPPAKGKKAAPPAKKAAPPAKGKKAPEPEEDEEDDDDDDDEDEDEEPAPKKSSKKAPPPAKKAAPAAKKGKKPADDDDDEDWDD